MRVFGRGSSPRGGSRSVPKGRPSRHGHALPQGGCQSRRAATRCPAAGLRWPQRSGARGEARSFLGAAAAIAAAGLAWARCWGRGTPARRERRGTLPLRREGSAALARLVRLGALLVLAARFALVSLHNSDCRLLDAVARELFLAVLVQRDLDVIQVRPIRVVVAAVHAELVLVVWERHPLIEAPAGDHLLVLDAGQEDVLEVHAREITVVLPHLAEDRAERVLAGHEHVHDGVVVHDDVFAVLLHRLELVREVVDACLDVYEDLGEALVAQAAALKLGDGLRQALFVVVDHLAAVAAARAAVLDLLDAMHELDLVHLQVLDLLLVLPREVLEVALRVLLRDDLLDDLVDVRDARGVLDLAEGFFEDIDLGALVLGVLGDPLLGERAHRKRSLELLLFLLAKVAVGLGNNIAAHLLALLET
mmetsp:Transcript_4576/g.13192  ORF Transcript_4576/g.13192 Transcript_4576/m.13192 type:complete len:421 (-) Transcript_4576:541-1803(-)